MGRMRTLVPLRRTPPESVSVPQGGPQSHGELPPPAEVPLPPSPDAGTPYEALPLDLDLDTLYLFGTNAGDVLQLCTALELRPLAFIPTFTDAACALHVDVSGAPSALIERSHPPRRDRVILSHSVGARFEALKQSRTPADLSQLPGCVEVFKRWGIVACPMPVSKLNRLHILPISRFTQPFNPRLVAELFNTVSSLDGEVVNDWVFVAIFFGLKALLTDGRGALRRLKRGGREVGR